MFRFFSFRNSLLSSSLISAGKFLTIILVICLFFNPSLAQGIDPASRTVLGITAIIFAGLGLFSCFFGFSKEMLIAAFWIGAIYSLSHAFIGASGEGRNYSKSRNIPQYLPGGLVYQEIPENSGSLLNAGLNFPKTDGMMGKFYSYLTSPIQQTSSTLGLESIGITNLGFSDSGFSSGGLPTEAFFGKKQEKRNFYPIKGPSKDTSLMSLLGVLPSK